MVLDQSLARAVSRKSLADWITAGAAFESALGKLLGRAQWEVQVGRPPIKAIKKVFDEVAELLRLSALPGEIKVSGGRRRDVTICVPEASGETVSFVLVSGTISGRSGAITLMRQRVLIASKHVLQRLHQRLGTKESLVVLQEIFSCLVVADALREASCTAGALHWPLLSANGLFVCAPSEAEESTVLITWIRRDQVGKKWKHVVDDLGAANSSAGGLLEDRELCVELLRLHSWLLRPHAPGPDLIAEWWASRPASEQDGVARNFEKLLSEEDVDASLHDPHELNSTQVLGGPGERIKPHTVGPTAQAHVVKLRDRYTGIVVQFRGKGTCIVALRNGFFGTLRRSLEKNGTAVLSSWNGIRLGARVQVEVSRMVGDHYIGPHTVLLELAEDAEAYWSIVKSQYPVGISVDGSIVWRGSGGSLIAFDDGVSGWLADSELSWLKEDLAVADSLVLARRLRLQVVGHAPKHRRIMLSLREAEGHPLDRVEESAFVGTSHRGVVATVMDYGVFVRMPIGCSGLLHRTQIPEGLSLAAGDLVEVRVSSIDKQRRRVALAWVTDAPVRPRTVGYPGLAEAPDDLGAADELDRRPEGVGDGATEEAAAVTGDGGGCRGDGT